MLMFACLVMIDLLTQEAVNKIVRLYTANVEAVQNVKSTFTVSKDYARSLDDAIQGKYYEHITDTHGIWNKRYDVEKYGIYTDPITKSNVNNKVNQSVTRNKNNTYIPVHFLGSTAITTSQYEADIMYVSGQVSLFQLPTSQPRNSKIHPFHFLRASECLTEIHAKYLTGQYKLGGLKIQDNLAIITYTSVDEKSTYTYTLDVHKAYMLREIKWVSGNSLFNLLVTSVKSNNGFFYPARILDVDYRVPDKVSVTDWQITKFATELEVKDSDLTVNIKKGFYLCQRPNSINNHKLTEDYLVQPNELDKLWLKTLEKPIPPSSNQIWWIFGGITLAVIILMLLLIALRKKVKR